MFRADKDWLERYAARTGRGGRALAQLAKKTNILGEIEKAQSTVKPESAHENALITLEEKPELLAGKQEHYEQVRIFWHFEQFHPDIYKRLVATPNGGYRGKKAGGTMLAEGQKKGYPDMSLDIPRGVYHGMRIELKYGKNTLSKEQKDYLRQLSNDGYYCVLCVGFTEAIEAIMAYWYLQPGEGLPRRERDMKWAA